MADKVDAKLEVASKEEVAFKLWTELRSGSAISTDDQRKEALQLYADCLSTVMSPQFYRTNKFRTDGAEVKS